MLASTDLDRLDRRKPADIANPRALPDERDLLGRFHHPLTHRRGGNIDRRGARQRGL